MIELLLVLPLELLIKTLQMKRSSHYYAKKALQKPDKYAHIRCHIHEIAEENFFTYDSPRIWLVLRTKGISCLLYTSPSPRDRQKSRMPSSA